MSHDSILRLHAVFDRTGLSRSTLTRGTGWRESAISAWMKNPMFFHVDDLPAE